MTVLSTKAGVKSRLASFTEFSTEAGSSDVMSRQPYGSVTISQLVKGVEYPNAQSAIDDIRGFAVRAINTIEINDDGISPEGISQIDQWAFDGAVEDDTLTAGDEVVISVFGFSVKALVGDTGEEFAAKVKLVLEDAITASYVISAVEVSSSAGNILNVTYADNQQHNLVGSSFKGITITPTILSPAKAGYGAWVRIGTKTETLDGSATPVILHYFKRIA